MQNRFVLKFFLIFLLVASSSTQLAFAHASLLRIRSGSTFEADISFMGSFAKDQDAERLIARYVTVGRADLEACLGRAQTYFPIFEFYLQEAALPNMLKYLPVVESELKPEAVSSSGAAGLWQIMPRTGRHYGLRIDDVVDARKDPHLSTRAAVAYLTELQTEFCDWLLVLAAYNCGPGKVRSAIRRAGSVDYHVIKQLLPRQTQRYISKFVAVSKVGHIHRALGLKPDMEDTFTGATQLLHIEGHVSLNLLAEQTGVSVGVIQALNPSLKLKELPDHTGGWHIVLPQEAVRQYFRQYDAGQKELVIAPVAAKKNELYSVFSTRWNRLKRGFINKDGSDS